jgi:hypothetical protein
MNEVGHNHHKGYIQKQRHTQHTGHTNEVGHKQHKGYTECEPYTQYKGHTEHTVHMQRMGKNKFDLCISLVLL